jgi:flagellar basal body-associated protein FliL
MIRFTGLLIAAVVFAVTAQAAGGGGGHGAEAKREPGVPSLDLPPFMAPVSVNGELKFYMYIVVKLDLTSDFKKPVVLEKVPYLQDAMLRFVHTAPIAPLAGTEKIDEAALAAGLKPIVDNILGPDVVQQVGFRNLAKAAY